MLLKILQYSQENTCTRSSFQKSCRRSFTEPLRLLALDFRSSKYLFPAESDIYCWYLQRFLFLTSLKTRVKPQKQPLELFCKKDVLQAYACHLIKKIPQHKCFPVEFTKFLRTPNLKSANNCFWNLLFHLDCPF